MEKGYKILGNYIRLVDERNKNLAVTKLLGVSISKKFIPSIANIVGTDLSNYKIVRTGQFAYGPVTSRNGEKISIAYLDEEDCIISSSYTVFEVENKEELDPEYLMLWFSRPEFDRYARYKSHGSVREIFDWNELCMVELPVPDIEKQRKIVKAYKTITDRIDLKQKINDNLLQQALAIYKAWFCDYVLSDGVLPESWHITTIDALSSLVTRGIAPKYDDNNTQIVLNQKCIRDHTIDVSLARRHLPKKINEKWISKGDLLINSTGTGTLGRVAQVWFDANNMTVDSHITIVRPKAAILQSYIGFWGLSHESEIEAQHTGSTGQTELPRDRVKAMELTLPDEDTLSKFNELVIPMTDAVVSNQKENARLSQLRDTLLPKLMSGKIDVSELEL